MKTVRISLWNEAYVKMLCNCLAESAKNKRFLQAEVRRSQRWYSGNSFIVGEKVVRN